MNTTQRNWQPDRTLLQAYQKRTSADELIDQCVRPETPLERQIIADPCWRTGALWGKPRPGHPEGKVLYHIHEVLKNVDKATEQPLMRQQLRLVTILHDTFKHLEEKKRPRTDWNLHHAIIARDFAREHVTDQAVLDVIELHDDAYYAWCAQQYHYPDKCDALMEALLQRLDGHLQLYYLFFKCDTQTGDKIQAPIGWFEKRLSDQLDLVHWE